ncbi:ClpP family protease [Nannocystaceae bacterium ST9]|jgi:ATP-dependent Clp protease, protease subunit
MTTRLDEKGDKDEKDEKNEGLRIQEKMLEARTILVADEVSDEMYRKVASSLILLERLDPVAPITVFVNSPGGSADSGFAIYDLLRFTSCPVRTVANGVVASAAVLIYLGAPKGQRHCLPNARFLLHQPSTMVRGRQIDIDIAAKEIIKLRRRYNEIVAETTGKPVEVIDRDSDRDFWLSAGEAKEYGLVDHVVRNRQELEARTS